MKIGEAQGIYRDQVRAYQKEKNNISKQLQNLRKRMESRPEEKEGFQSTRIRRVGINFLSFLGKLLTGVRVKDITSGYRVVNTKFIRIFALDYPADYPEPEAMVIAAVHGGRIKEYPVIMRERKAGESSITMKKSIYYMCKVTLAMIIRRISFGVRR